MNRKLLLQPANKRQFLKGLSAVLGAGALSQLSAGNALASAVSYQPHASKQQGQLFSNVEMATLHDICSVVIPETDSPSAAQLDVHGFIEHQLLTCHQENDRKNAKSILNSIEHAAKSQFGSSFVQLKVTEQTRLLQQLEARRAGFNRQDVMSFKSLKYLIVFGFFTTEVGATQVLAYQAVPGGFKGSIPYSSVGKSYGSLDFY